MHNKNYNPNRKRQYGRSTTHLPLKSVHTVLDEQLRRLMKLETDGSDDLVRVEAVIRDLTDGAKHSFTFGDVLRAFVQHFPELKTKKKNELGGNRDEV